MATGNGRPGSGGTGKGGAEPVTPDGGLRAGVPAGQDIRAAAAAGVSRTAANVSASASIAPKHSAANAGGSNAAPGVMAGGSKVGEGVKAAAVPGSAGGAGDMRDGGGYHNTRADLRDAATAIAKRWPIDERLKAAIVGRAAKILGEPGNSARMHLAAARVLLVAEAQNQADELKTQPDLTLNLNVEVSPVTADGQRAAIGRAIAAEMDRRAALASSGSSAAGADEAAADLAAGCVGGSRSLAADADADELTGNSDGDADDDDELGGDA